MKLLSHYIIYVGRQTGLVHSNPISLTTRGLLLFETGKQPTTREPAKSSHGNNRDEVELEQTKISTEAETHGEAQMGNLVPLNPLPLTDALPYVEQVPWDLEIAHLDAVALRLLENSDSVVMIDQLLSNPKDTMWNSRKEPRGSDIFLDVDRFQTWHQGISDVEFPLMGVSSGLFEVDADESWPCLNRIPTPSLSEPDGLVGDESWMDMMQDDLPLTNCGILPSCSSSIESADSSPCESLRPQHRQYRLDDNRSAFISTY